MADAFVLCVSSHGNEGYIVTTDNQRLRIKKLTGYFDGLSCPALVGKPKIFIIDVYARR